MGRPVEPFFKVSVESYTRNDLNRNEKAVFTGLCSFANNETGKCWPSLVTISKRTGVSKTLVKESLKGLIEKNVIKKQNRTVGDSSEPDSNLYIILGRSNTDIPMSNNDIQVGQIPTMGMSDTDHKLDSLNYTNKNYKNSLSEDPKGYVKHWKSISKKRGSIDYPSEFINFWESYPNPQSKKNTFTSWLITLESNNYNNDELLTAARNYSQSVKGSESKFIKHSTTFLSTSEPWKDYTEIKNIKSEYCPICGTSLFDGRCPVHGTI